MTVRQLIVSIFIAGATSVVLAGATQPFPVEIDLDNRIASGDMVTARFSDNDDELIGCGVRHIQAGTEVIKFAFCQARLGPAPEDLIVCNTLDPDLVEAVHAISDFSFVTFSWNEDLECTRIGNSTQSFYLPALKLQKQKKGSKGSKGS